jgi:hypothetical protein
MSRIVVWDPEGEYWEGALVDETRARVLEARHVVTLPVDASLLKRGGVAGYHRRSWGAGWPLDHFTPRMACPLTMFVDQAHRTVDWVARLALDPGKPGAKPEDLMGQLRLVGDGAQGGADHASLTPNTPAVDVRTLAVADEWGGWTVGGRCTMHAPADRHYGFSLYGTAPGLRVLWAAVSLTA